jgi:hypothetical protein
MIPNFRRKKPQNTTIQNRRSWISGHQIIRAYQSEAFHWSLKDSSMRLNQGRMVGQKKMKVCDSEYPATAWELERKKRIEALQGR